MGVSVYVCVLFVGGGGGVPASTCVSTCTRARECV